MKQSMPAYALTLAKEHVRRFRKNQLLVAVSNSHALEKTFPGGRIEQLHRHTKDLAVIFTPVASGQKELWINPRVAHGEIAKEFFFERMCIREDVSYQMDHALSKVAATSAVGLVRMTPVLNTCNGSCGSAIEKSVASGRLNRNFCSQGYELANVPELLKMCSAASFGKDTRGTDHLVVSLMCGIHQLYGFMGISGLDEAYWERKIVEFGELQQKVFGEVG